MSQVIENTGVKTTKPRLGTVTPFQGFLIFEKMLELLNDVAQTYVTANGLIFLTEKYTTI